MFDFESYLSSLYSYYLWLIFVSLELWRVFQGLLERISHLSSPLISWNLVISLFVDYHIFIFYLKATKNIYTWSMQCLIMAQIYGNINLTRFKGHTFFNISHEKLVPLNRFFLWELLFLIMRKERWHFDVYWFGYSSTRWHVNLSLRLSLFQVV